MGREPTYQPSQTTQRRRIFRLARAEPKLIAGWGLLYQELVTVGQFSLSHPHALQDSGSAATTAQGCKETLYQGKGRLSLCPTSQVGWVLAQPSTAPGT